MTSDGTTGAGHEATTEAPAGAPAGEIGSRTATDWDRYGLARPTAGKSALPSNKPSARRAVEPRDDMYLEYRRENLSRGRAAARSARSRANSLAVASVGLAAILVVGAAWATSGPGPTRSPTPTPAPSRTPTPEPTVAPVVLTAYETTVVNVGLSAAVPDRATRPDDGTTMYLFGPDGGVAIVTFIGATGTQFEGEPFATGLPIRSVVDDGNVWISTSPNPGAPCGPSCWDQSTTYRLNIGTGKVQQAYPKTYLVGFTDIGLFLATAGKVEVVDPATGKPLRTIVWPAGGEPRLGCDRLWDVAFDRLATTLTVIDANGVAGLKSSAPPSTTYGPVAVDGDCRMLSGQGGFAAVPATVTQIVVGQAGKSTVVQHDLILLDGHLWANLAHGRIQRYDAATDQLVGPVYELAGAGPYNPAQLFASMGSVWLLDPARGQLIGFAVPTAVEPTPEPTPGAS
jgi:hypothetical protein